MSLAMKIEQNSTRSQLRDLILLNETWIGMLSLMTII